MAKPRKKFVLLFDDQGNAKIKYPEDGTEDVFPVPSPLRKNEIPQKFTPPEYYPRSIN